MASRKDYAKTKRGKASASRAKPAPKRAPAKQKKRFPTGLLALTLLLLGGLGYGLYNLTKVDPGEASTPLANSKPKPAQTAEKPKPAPSKPVKSQAPVVEKSTASTDKNRFEFYEMLKESEVEAPKDVYKSTPKDAKTQHKYVLQAGSFKAKADAERMRAQLILLGLPNVHTNISTSKDGTQWYRVRVGPFDNRSRLSKAYDKLVQQNIQPLRIKQ